MMSRTGTDMLKNNMLICLMTLTLTWFQGVGGSHCNHREPQLGLSNKVTGDNGFFLSFNGQPTHYIPEATYTVSLSGDQDAIHRKQFSQFVLVAENSDSHRMVVDSGSAGTYQLLGDVQTKFSDHCTNTVTETSTVPKDDIQVLWTAPSTGNGCVIFKATAVEEGGLWSIDDSRLSHTLCEEKEEEEEMNIINTPCCACKEAKYEVMFQGLWNKETHPRDFPASEWLLHFSDLIGASHSADYRVWEAGSLASKGLTQVAKWGSPRLLESELKTKSKHIRTIIKARGLWHPNTNGKTFAIFRTDPENHLVSMVSMLGPSPDWIVGVSALELCLANCTWLDSKTIDLYPWDAGVDDGISYESPDSPTSPAQPIKRITSQDPANEDSPFYHKGGGIMKPLAKLTIQKLREYKKSCSEGETDGVGEGEKPGFEPQKPAVGCETTSWSQWSGCSVTCGKGISSRKRLYLDPLTADNVGCDLQMIQKEMCASQIPVCDGQTSFYQSAPTDWVADDTCATTEWSDWSACSVKCGQGDGFRVRTRRFFNRMGRKKCPHIETVTKEGCRSGKAVCGSGEMEEEIQSECAVTEWSFWSPCSQSCGGGLKVRTRLYRITRDQQLQAGCTVQLMQKGTCSSLADCSNRDLSSSCSLPRDIGPCRGAFRRWYFDTKTSKCLEFFFGGCRGNQNNFMTIEDCTKECGSQAQHPGQIKIPAVKKKPDIPVYLNDGFKDALDVLVKKRREDESEGMNKDFMELEEHRLVVDKLEMEKEKMEKDGINFNRVGELMAAQKKLMMMEKRMMMDKQMMMFKQKQMMMAKQKQMMMTKQKQMMMAKQQQIMTKQMNQLTGSLPMNHLTNVSLTPSLNRDCVVTAWSPWSVQCSTSCGSRGFRHRFRSVSQEPSGDQGKPCPRRMERRKKCRLPPCPSKEICSELSPWGGWGPCSHTCGTDGSQTRERVLMDSTQLHCSDLESDQRQNLLETRVCLLPCCPGHGDGCY